MARSADPPTGAVVTEAMAASSSSDFAREGNAKFCLICEVSLHARSDGV